MKLGACVRKGLALNLAWNSCTYILAVNQPVDSKTTSL